MGRERDARRVVDAYNHYATRQKDRLIRLGAFLGEAMPVVVDMDACNTRFLQAGRPDLVMTQPAAMNEYPSPDDLRESSNNFILKFSFAASEAIVNGPLGRSTVQATPMTEDDVREMAHAPLSDSDINWNTHAMKPAFHRMLILFPDFTASLVASVSRANEKEKVGRFAQELFVAYQLLSQLVDTKDQSVIRDGEIDKLYLIR